MAQRTRKVKSRSALFAPLSFLLIFAAAAFGLSIFFRVHTITVTGNSRYTEEEIIEASGIEEGDNLFFINRGTVTARINTRLPYVEQAVIRRSLPNRLEIRVTESDAVAILTAEEGKWVVDRSCKLLAEADSGSGTDLIQVTGLTITGPEVGLEAVAAGSDGPKIAYLKEILREISELGLQSDVGSIDMSNIANPSFTYLDRFHVKLGTNENLDYKFQILLSAAAKLSEGDRGTLDLSIDHRAHLTYD